MRRIFAHPSSTSVFLFIAFSFFCVALSTDSPSVREETTQYLEIGVPMFQLQSAQSSARFHLPLSLDIPYLMILPCSLAEPLPDKWNLDGHSNFLSVHTSDKDIILNTLHQYVNATLQPNSEILIQTADVGVSYALIVTDQEPYFLVNDGQWTLNDLQNQQEEDFSPWHPALSSISSELPFASLCRLLSFSKTSDMTEKRSVNQDLELYLSSTNSSASTLDQLSSTSFSDTLAGTQITLGKREGSFLLTQPIRLVSTPTVATRCVPVQGLSFCSMVKYNVAFSDNGSPNALDNSTQSFFNAFSKKLFQYNCADPQGTYFYSAHQSCENCLNSYKNWLCVQAFPSCSSNNEIVKPCIEFCYQTARSCPSFLQFTCPTDATMEATYAGQDKVCNSMSLTLNVPSEASKRLFLSDLDWSVMMLGLVFSFFLHFV